MQARVKGSGLEENRQKAQHKVRGSGFKSVDVDLDSAGAAVECRRRPGHPAVAVNLNVHVQRHVEHTVVAANKGWRGTFFYLRRLL